MHAVDGLSGQIHRCRISIGRHAPCRRYGFTDGLSPIEGIETGLLDGTGDVDKGFLGQGFFDDRYRFGHDRKEGVTKID